MRFIFVFICLYSSAVFAQESIEATVTDGKPFVEHSVKPGETVYGLSRAFNVDPKDFALLNKLDLKTGLKEGQVVKMPLKTTNLFTKTCAGCTKVVYKVQPKEGLYRVGVNFNNIGSAGIKSLNNLPSDNISIGQELVVGYLKYDKSISINSSAATEQPAVETPPVVVKTETKPVEVVKEKIAEKPVVKEPVPEPVKEVKNETPVIAAEVKNTGNAEEIKSAFATQYGGKAGYATTATAAVFKSTSGWDDNKYYVLMTNVPAGTIVKITSFAANKFIYAKVLGELPDIKQNEGIVLRLSNAASAALDHPTEDKWQVSVAY